MSTAHGMPAATASPADTVARFPAAPCASAAAYFGAYAKETVRAVASIEHSALDRAAAILLGAYTRGAGAYGPGRTLCRAW